MKCRVLATLVLVALAALAGCNVLASDGPPEDDAFSFEEVSAVVGYDYDSINSPGINGDDGAYAVDYDNDLRTDLFALGGGSPTLYRNTGGAFERTDAIPEVSGTLQGALFFDHDNDGLEDLLVLRRDATPVFLENREGSFERKDVGIEREFVAPVSADVADYTGDGCLDLFVVDYGDWFEDPPKGWGGVIVGQDNGEPNQLFRGTCGSFEPVDDAGIEGTHWSLATSFVDLNADGNPDIHVANDFFNDTLYTGTGDGTFDREVLPGETDRNGMSSHATDVTGDGRLDVFVTNIYFPRDRWNEIPESNRVFFEDFMVDRVGGRTKGNNLLVGSEDGFSYEGAERNVSDGGWGWGSSLQDFESDGDVDIFHGNQFEVRFGGDYPHYTRPFLFAQHDGEFHRQNSSALGFEETNDRGVVGIDYDVDGAMDLAVATDQESHRLYRNDTPQEESLQVVVGAGSIDHTAIGARVEATADGETHLRVNDAKADYQSQETRTLHFGVDDATTVAELHIEWPDGTERTFEDVETGQRIHVTPDGIRERRAYGE